MPAKKKAAAKKKKPAAPKKQLPKVTSHKTNGVTGPAAAAKSATKPVAAPARSFTSGDSARAQLARLAPLDAATRTVYARQVSLPELAHLGGQTIAVNVLREAGKWITDIAEARAQFPELQRRYSDQRFAYLCERVVALEAQLVQEGVRDAAITAARSDAGAALTQARIERDHLLGILEPIVRGDPVGAGNVIGIRSDRHDDALQASLGKLADIAESWLDRAHSDFRAATLVRTFGLGDDDVAHARAAASALVTTAKSSGGAGTKHGHDSPDVNVLEGVVLAELRVALGVFHAARTRDPSLPALTPGPGTSPALAAHARHVARTSKVPPARPTA